MNVKRIAPLGAVALVVGVVVVAACGGGDTVEVQSGTVIQNATIVDTRDGSLVTGMSIIVDGGKVQKITGSAVQATGSAVTIDATGKYVVPGFLDMHTHLLDSPLAEQPLVQKLLIANGITGIREMRGSPDAGRRARSRLNTAFAGGRQDRHPRGADHLGLDHRPERAAGSLRPPRHRDAVQEVQTQKTYGAGFIKTINATHDASLAFLVRSQEPGPLRGRPFEPVAQRAWTPPTPAGMRWSTWAPAWAALLGCSTAGRQRCAPRSNQPATAWCPRPTRRAGRANAVNAPLYQTCSTTPMTPTKCTGIGADLRARTSTWHVPTLIRLRTQRFAERYALFAPTPTSIYVSKATRTSVAKQPRCARRTTLPPTALATFHQYFDHEQSAAAVAEAEAACRCWRVPTPAVDRPLGASPASACTRSSRCSPPAVCRRSKCCRRRR